MPLPAGSVVVSLYPPQAPSGGSGATPIGSLPSSPSGAAGWQWCSTRSPPVIIGGINYYEDVGPADAWIGTGFSGEPTIGAVPPGFGNPYTNGTGTYAGSYRSAITAFQAHPGRTPFVSPPMPSCSSPPPGGGTQPTGGGGGGGSPPGACTTLCGPLTIQTTCESPLWIKNCPEPPAPVPPCELTIAWLSLHYPDFVQAERSAAKTDYDVLLDAFKLGLCSGAMPEMPECSVPYLERVAPDFVRAAKAQDMSDEDMLNSAVAVGLCAKSTYDMGMTEEEITSLVPGSEAVIEAEFDPPIDPTQLGKPFTVDTGASGSCPPAQFVMPDYSAEIGKFIPPEVQALTGWDRVMYGMALAVSSALRQTCECPDGSGIDLIFKAAEASAARWGISGTIIAQALKWVGNIARTLSCNAGVLDNYVTQLIGCGAGETTPLALLGVLAGVWNRWVGVVPEWLAKAMTHATNYTCPTELPSAAEANALLAHNFITLPVWETIQRFEGNRIDYQKPIVDLERSRPTDDQLLLMQRKLRTAADNAAQGNPQPGDPGADYIPLLQSEISDLFKNNGWTNNNWFQWWVTAQEWVPAPTDAINWMLKDVADPQIQETFLLDAEFRQKYNGHVKDVFAWNGISDRDAEYLWRAHWRNMAPHQLYQLHKRLRPGWTVTMSDQDVTHLFMSICPRARPRPEFDPYANRPVAQGADVSEYVAAGVPLEIATIANAGFPVPTYCDEIDEPLGMRAYLESLATTGYHVYEGLGQDDYPAFWRQRLLALSYNVMGRTDLRRAYEIGAIDLTKLEHGYMDQGYSPGDAVTLAAFTRNAAIQLHARRPIANQWVNTGYDSDKLQVALERQGMRRDMWPQVYSILRARRDIKIQQDCLKAIEKNYLVGLLTQDQVEQQIDALGITGADAFNLIKDWNCVKATRTKQDSAAQICLYFKTGLMTGADAQAALVSLGYTKVQSRRILATCYIRKLPKTIQVDKLPEALGILGTLPQ